MSDEFYDEDGFRLDFEDDTADQEKQFFMRAFPNVNKISERKVHCTSCYMHIGTAPITEAVIRMHPILRVTHCRNCHTFYNSGEFDKGEDGSELYCRWCGQGGEVYCCSKCPYVFCKKCIVQNLSRACVQDISRNDNWQCFSCAPKIMWHLRAQHWALVNYIEKQKKDMKDKNLSVQTINNLMKQDNTTCCGNKGLNKKGGTPVAAKKGTKRPSDANEITSPGAAKIPDQKRILPRPIMPVQQAANTPPAPKKVKTDNNEVVCTPDIMSMFMNPEEPPPLVATRTPPVAKPPAVKPTPPPTLPATVPGRQVVVRPAIPANANPVTMRMPMSNQANSVPPPVYHTINGYRIDLHTAAQQGTYRLPNGKLIQVRKQAPTATPAPAQPPNVTVSRTIAPKPPNTYFNPVGMGQNPPTRMTNGGSNMHINLALQQQQQLQEQRLQQQRQQQQQQQMLQQRQQQLMLQAQAQAQAQAGQPQPTIVAGQPNPALQLPTLAMLQNMVNGTHEDSPLGKSRKNFEGKLLSGVEICQHIVNKINTLTNSNSFKNIRNVRDLKELYIHVSYLLTYAIGRFKTLQEKCVDDVKKMGFTKESDFVMMGDQISNRNPDDEDKSDDEDDCEIIEQNTTLIELDSEDDDDSSSKKKKDDRANKGGPCSQETEAAVATILQEKDDVIHASSEAISVDCVPQISAVEGNVNLDKIDLATTGESTENTSTEASTKEAVDGGASTEAEQSKNDDDLVEIIDADENEASKNDADKVVESAAASKDGDEPDDVVEIIDAGEDEEQQEKETDKADVEEKKDSVDEERVEQIAEEKQPEKEADVVEVEQKQDSVEDEKMEQVAEEKQESAVTVLLETEEASKEVEDVEMETAETEKPTEVKSVDGSKGDESEDKENESPEVNSEEPENTVPVEKEADKEDAESDKVVEVEKMDVDAQKDDIVESSSAMGSTQEEENCGELEDAPVSTEPVKEDPLTVSDSEQAANQTEDKAPVEGSVSESEEPKTSEIEPPLPETTDESKTAKPAEPVDAPVEDTAKLSEEDTEAPVAEETPTNSFPVDEANAVSTDDAPSAPVAEETPKHAPSADEAIAASTEDSLETPSAEKIPSDASPAVEAPIASTEDVSEAPAAEETPTAVETMVAPTEDVPEIPSVEEILAAESINDESPAVEDAPESTDPIGEDPIAAEDIPDVPTGSELLAQIEDSFQKLQEMIDSTEETNEAETVTGDEQMEVDEDVTAAGPEESEDSSPSEEQQEVLAQSADDTESSDVPMVDDEGSVECNGLLEENGSASSGESQDAPEEILTGDNVPTEIVKTASIEFEDVNSPEMINGDC